MSWFRLDEDVLDDPKLVELQHEIGGPMAIATWVFALAMAKRRNAGGEVELSPLVLAKALAVDRDVARQAIDAAASVGLLDPQGGANRYTIPNWSAYQPDPRANGDARKAARESRGVPGTSGIAPDNKTGQDKTGPDGTGPDGTERRSQTGSRGQTASRPTPAAPDPDSVEECEHLADLIERNGSKRPTVSAAWLLAADRLRRIDGRTHQQVMQAIEWCQADEFWRANVLSMPKLREKYDQLRLAARRSPQARAEDRTAARLAAADELQRELEEKA